MSEYQGKLPSSILSIPKVVAFIFDFSGHERSSSLLRCKINSGLLQVHDRAQVFLSCSTVSVRNPRYVGVIERWSSKTLEIPNFGCSANTSLYILVIFLASSL